MARTPVILIVDDMDTDAMKTAKYVLSMQLEVDRAADPLEAIKMIQTGKCLPDLVVMDVMMPHLDGFQTMDKIRHIKGYEQIPFIVNTSSKDPYQEDYAAMSNAATFLKKPVDELQFVNAVTRILGQVAIDRAKRKI